MKITFKLIIIIVSLFFVNTVCAKVWINEFMQSNVDELWDDLQDFPDSWVELYNDDMKPVNLHGWIISLYQDYSSGWKIDSLVHIPANGYLIIYCDKVGKGLHTDFRLESRTYGNLYLFDSKVNLIDKVEGFPKQPAPNIARGRIKDGGSEWGYFVYATPGAKNQGDRSEILAPDPIFSLEGGIYNHELELSFSLPERFEGKIESSHIYYTTDGSEPTVFSTKYRGPIIISETVGIRAKVISPGYLIGRSVTHSYIMTERDLNLPVVSINLNPEYLWDESTGIYVEGNGIYGIEGIGRPEKLNWNQNWRRPMNIEYFPFVGKESVINQLGELRIGGNYSRTYAQKSLIIYSNKRFGENRFDYDFFKDKPNQKIKSLMLRNSGNDYWSTHFRDAAIQLLMGGKLNLDYQAYQPAIVYINGEYFGILNLRERSNDDFVFANYDGLENIDMVKDFVSLIVGDMDSFNNMLSDIQKAKSPDEIDRIMDVDEALNYYMLQICVGNNDFPHNNIVMWCSKAIDAKWRFILKDTDWGLGLHNMNKPHINMFEHCMKNNKSSIPFTALMNHKKFREEFYGRLAVYMETYFHSDTILNLVDSLSLNISREIPYHLERWFSEEGEDYRDINNWLKDVEFMKEWTLQRNEYLYSQMSEFFSLGRAIPVSVELPEHIQKRNSFSVNGVKINNLIYSGKYFRQAIMRVNWEDKESEYFMGWKISVKARNKEFSFNSFGKEANILIPEDCEEVKVSVIETSGHSIELNNEEILIYSNSENIIVEKIPEISVVTVCNNIGQIVYKGEAGLSALWIPVAYDGIFVVNIKNEFGTITKKILKNKEF